MTEIFISYRRSGGEGWARDIYGELIARLPEIDRDQLFLDSESIEFGERFPDRLSQAIASSKVVLAIIDRHWLEEQAGGLCRLDDPHDFVRREIEQALSQENQRERSRTLIPVLCGGALMPAPERLPETLRPLCLLNAAEVRGKDHDKQLDALVRELRDIFDLPEANTLPHGDAESLPYLCDRSDQDSRFCELVRTHSDSPRSRRPLLCVVHGHAAEAHRELVRRLANRSLRKCLPHLTERDSIRLHSIDWAIPVASPETFQERFREKLVGRLGIPIRGRVTDEHLVEGLKRLRTKVVVVEQTVMTHDLDGVDHTHFERQREYWASFPDLPNGLVIVSFVCLKYSDEEIGFLNRWLPFLGGGKKHRIDQRLKEFEQAVRDERRVICDVLPILKSARHSDVENWAGEGDVAEFFRKRKMSRLVLTDQELRDLFQGQTELPMDDVGRRLQRLLDGAGGKG